MSKGIAKVKLEGSAGQVMPQGAGVGDWDFLYQTSTVKPPKWNVGDRVVLPDVRVFRLAKATNIVPNCKYGLKFWNRISDGVAVALGAALVVGDRSLTIAAAGVTLDEYRGGYVILHGGTHHQFRGVVGNSATDTAGNIIVYLDAAIQIAVAAGQWTELVQSPYDNVNYSGVLPNDYTSVAGIPNVTTVAANQYLWLQTWGPIWVNPHGASLTDAGLLGGERKLVFDAEGSICIEDDVAHGGMADTDEHQIAGFIIDRQEALTSGPPLVMLTISP